MLIPSERLQPGDLEAWERLARFDLAHARLRRFAAQVERSKAEIRAFAAERCWVGVSWGKDSVCVAHLAYTVDPSIPLCWVRTPIWETPETFTVRDAFLAAHPGANYREFEDHELPIRRSARTGRAYAVVNDAETWPPERVFGPRYIGGIRASESKTREIRVNSGLTSLNTCAPIGRWSDQDVFSYLALHGLPIHPAYAMSCGGQLERGRLRVSPIGDERGAGMGRREWETRYYGDIVHQLEMTARGKV